MMFSIIVLFFTCFNLSTAYLLNNVNRQGIGKPVSLYYTDIPVPKDDFYLQKLDHFDPTNENVWRQRFWRNPYYYKPGGPIFLMINGEAPAEAEWAISGQWMSYANESNALCFLVEHRFYGNSRPVSDASSANLKYLSSEQALADLAYFIEGMNEKYNFSGETKWIVFGGSYAGSLAAWLRMKYPHLVYGAVSSSGPLLAKIDFYEYFQVVKNALESYQKECPAEISNANKHLSVLVQTKSGRSQIQKIFNLCEPLINDSSDIANLFENLAGNFADVVQYNADNRNSATKNVTIDTVCDIMTGMNSLGKTALERYAEVNKLSLAVHNQSCLSFLYRKYINNLKKTDWESAGENGRQWLYQTCTEFGFYQSSSKPSDIFGDYFPADFFVQQCGEIFGSDFSDRLLRNGVSRTNIIYGALNVNSGNIIFVHGSVDPWHTLGILREVPHKDFKTIFIQGTAHCADMYPSSPTDSTSLQKAREEIKKTIRSWLSDTTLSIEHPSKGTLKLRLKISKPESVDRYDAF